MGSLQLVGLLLDSSVMLQPYVAGLQPHVVGLQPHASQVGLLLDSSVMLPRRANDTKPPPRGALLTSHFVRQLHASMLPPAKMRFKCVVQPEP